MTNMRAKRQAEARQRWMRQKTDADERNRRTEQRVATALGKAKLVLADNELLKLLELRGIQSIPRFLATTDGVDGPAEIASELSNSLALEFAGAWCFLFPLLDDPVIVRQLESSWPGFVSEIKDAFIALVIGGPFPYTLSGESKGWKSAFYNFGVRERFRPPDSNDEKLLMAPDA